MVRTDDGFEVSHEIVERDERELALEVGELAQMATGMAGPAPSIIGARVGWTATHLFSARKLS